MHVQVRPSRGRGRVGQSRYGNLATCPLTDKKSAALLFRAEMAMQPCLKTLGGAEGSADGGHALDGVTPVEVHRNPPADRFFCRYPAKLDTKTTPNESDSKNKTKMHTKNK